MVKKVHFFFIFFKIIVIRRVLAVREVYAGGGVPRCFMCCVWVVAVCRCCVYIFKYGWWWSAIFLLAFASIELQTSRTIMYLLTVCIMRYKLLCDSVLWISSTPPFNSYQWHGWAGLVYVYKQTKYVLHIVMWFLYSMLIDIYHINLFGYLL